MLAAISLVASSRSGEGMLIFLTPSSIMMSNPFLSDTNLYVAVWSMLMGMVAGGRFVGVVRVIGIIQRPVVLHFLPHTIVLPRCVMVQPIMVNSTVQLALQSLVTDSNECDATPYTMSCHAFRGR